MTELAVTLEPFDLAHASGSEYQAMNRFSNAMRAEILPDDPSIPLEEAVAGMQNIPGFMRAFVWAAWNPEKTQIVGSAHAGFTATEENTHLVWLRLDVLPEWRRQGIRRRLLAAAAEVPRREGRRLMMTGTNARVPAGDAFPEKLGGERAMKAHTNQLALAELDGALLAQWLMPSPQTASRFTLEGWDGPHPDAEMDAIVAVMESATNTSPRDKMDLEDMHFTPEQMRQMEQQIAGRRRGALDPSGPRSVVRQAGRLHGDALERQPPAGGPAGRHRRFS